MKIQLLIAFAIAILLAPCMLCSQTVRMGFKVGANMSFPNYSFSTQPDTIYDPDGDYTKEREATPGAGFSLGYVFEWDLNEVFFLSSGLSVNGLSHKYIYKTTPLGSLAANEIQTFKYRLFGVQVPLVIQYRPIEKINIGFGVYGAWFFGGRENYNYSFNSSVNSGTRQLNFSSKGSQRQQDFRPFDGGIRFEAGFGAKRWRILASYDMGLANILPDADTQSNPLGYSLKRSVAGLSLIYHQWPR